MRQQRQDNLPGDMLIGAAAGTAATAPMTWFMKAVHAHLPAEQQDPLPPRQITERATAKAGIRDDLTPKERRKLSVAAHYAFGASAGSVYGALAGSCRPPALLGGIAFGLGVWAVSYLGGLPALGLYRAPRAEPTGRHAMMIGAHVVWGAALGLLTDFMAAPAGEERAGEPMEAFDERRPQKKTSVS